MTEIQLYNTATRRKELFNPIDPDNVRMYVCGPTVYDRAHIGNARPVIVFDTLYRLLRHVYGTDHVTYVRNFTDVDDKINARAAEEGRSIRELTDETTRWYLEDMAAIGALDPNKMPRATEWIDAMIAMIEGLIAKGHAYAAEGHVLFRVRSYAEYGALSGRSVDDMIAGARVEVAPYKEDPLDFVLWKPSSDDLPGWESPWGRGRPGWHIECSAMAFGLLGDTFDIHGGGNDLTFPHHENEIAQSKCMGHGFANVWMHNEMLQVEGKKMSKSLGNFFTVRDLLEGNWSGGWKVPGEVIRFVFLSTHYRKPMDWTETKAREAARELDFWVTTVRTDPELLDSKLDSVAPDPEIIEALADDLNTSLALTRLRQLARDVDDRGRHASDEVHLQVMLRFAASAKVLGFDLQKLAAAANDEPAKKDLEYFEHSLASERAMAMESKDFSEVDRLKTLLIGVGLEVRMSKDAIELKPGPDFDPSKLEALK